MRTQTLSNVTLQTLENYRTAATQAVALYRWGGHRFVGVVNGALESGLYPRTARLAPRATDRMNEVRGNVSEVVVKGIDQVAARTEKVIELGANTAAAQVSKVAKFADGIDNERVASGLHTAARLTLPGAKVALAVSGKVAESASALAGAAGVRPVRKTARKPAHKAVTTTRRGAARAARAPVVRKAKAEVVTAARRKVAQAAKSVKAPVAQAKRTARATKKAVAEVVAA